LGSLEAGTATNEFRLNAGAKSSLKIVGTPQKRVVEERDLGKFLSHGSVATVYHTSTDGFIP